MGDARINAPERLRHEYVAEVSESIEVRIAERQRSYP